MCSVRTHTAQYAYSLGLSCMHRYGACDIFMVVEWYTYEGHPIKNETFLIV